MRTTGLGWPTESRAAPGGETAVTGLGWPPVDGRRRTTSRTPRLTPH